MQPVLLVLLCEVTDFPKKPAWRCGNRSPTSIHCQAPSRQVIEWAGKACLSSTPALAIGKHVVSVSCTVWSSTKQAMSQ